MPELPEVEVLARHLDPLLRHRHIHDVHVLWDRTVRPCDESSFRADLKDRKILSVRRRAKFLLFELDPSPSRPGVLMGHLGMTGRIHVQPRDATIPRHSVVILDLGSDRLVFEDVRRFGRFHLDADALRTLGPEPLDAGFSPEVLGNRLGKSRRPIKDRLLDQTVVAGLGNIYASEALFRARISPVTPTRRLEPQSIRRLWCSIRETLDEAIDRGAAVLLGPNGERERLFHHRMANGAETQSGISVFRVYDRENLPCGDCGTAITRLRQSGRSTYYCPVCQLVQCADNSD